MEIVDLDMENDRTQSQTLMLSELLEAGDVVARLLIANRATLKRIGGRLRDLAPVLCVTCGRGSSGHVGTYAKYLFESLAGVTTAAAAPSMSSIYGFAPRRCRSFCLAVSQSGRSPDLLAAVEAQRQAGAYVVALVNQPGSHLEALADDTVMLEAGAERSVAATKSFIASLAAVAMIAAEWMDDAALATDVARLPELLARASDLDWSPALQTVVGAQSLFVIGRGYGLAAAREMALKLQETCAVHAEAFSSAEVKHGPMAIVKDGFPVLALCGSGQAGDDVRETAELFAGRGAVVHVADVSNRQADLPMIAAHAAIEPILAIQTFYRLTNQASLKRGLDPDNPPFLAKVTKTT